MADKLAGAGSGAASGAAMGTAIAPGYGTAIGAVAGGLAGYFTTPDGDGGSEYLQQALANLNAIVPPDLMKKIEYLEYQQGGSLTPEQISKLPEEYQQAYLIKGDIQTKLKQAANLDILKQMSETGMDARGALDTEKARRLAAADAQSRFNTIKAEANRSGGMTGGQSIAAQLSAAQNADDTEAMKAMEIAASAGDRRMQAIKDYMTGLSGFRSQNDATEAANTQALNQRQQFDINNSRSRQQYNANQRTAAQADMINRQRQTMDQNTKQQNDERYRLGYLAPQQMFQNQISKATGTNQALNNIAGNAQAQNAAQAQAMGQVWQGVGQLGTAYSNSQYNDKLLALKEKEVAAKYPASGSFTRTGGALDNRNTLGSDEFEWT
jgi:hypothetical protein